MKKALNTLGHLEPLIEADLEMILPWRNAPEVRNNMFTNHEISWQEHVDWFKRLQKDSSKKHFVWRENNIAHGVVCFMNYNVTTRSAFWGFYSAPRAPKGTGLKMEYAALEYAFDALNLHKLSCEVIAFNVAVVNMHIKVGFVKEGCFRDQHYDGKNYHDVIRLSILEEEWKQNKAALASRIGLMSNHVSGEERDN